MNLNSCLPSSSSQTMQLFIFSACILLHFKINLEIMPKEYRIICLQKWTVWFVCWYLVRHTVFTLGFICVSDNFTDRCGVLNSHASFSSFISETSFFNYWIAFVLNILYLLFLSAVSDTCFYLLFLLFSFGCITPLFFLLFHS